MNSNRKTARIVGVLFLTAMVTGMLRYFLLDSILDAPDYLINVSANEERVIMGLLFYFVMAVAVAGIAIVIYPILKKHNEALALGYVGARIVEAVLFFVGILTVLTLLTFSQEFVKAGAPDAFNLQTIGNLLLAVRHYTYNVLWSITLSLGAVMLYYLLYQSKLIPRWLSVWGFVGAILFPAGWVSLFGSTNSAFFILPLVVNEWVLAIWLIVKGFNPSAIASGSAKQK